LGKLGEIMSLPEKAPHFPANYNYIPSLDKVAKAGRLQEFLKTDDLKYYYWEKWKYKANEWGIDPQHLWTAAKFKRLANKTIQLSEIDGFNFSIGTPTMIQEHLHKFDMHLGGSFQGDGIIPADEKEQYLISSLMEEAIASSQIEGAATTRKVAKEMLESNRKPLNTSEQMIVNNYHAMQWIVENKDAPFTTENIKKLHSILTKSTLTDATEEGAFRVDNDVKVVDVQTGRIVYTPPESDQLDQLMADVCKFGNDQEKQTDFIHPITKAIILHFLIGYIHPFADGNGRTARTLFYWYLLKKGYWLIEYMSVSRVILNSKAQYARAYLYTEQDNNDLTYFIMYHLKAIHIALEDLKLYISRKKAEKQNVIALLRSTSFNDRQISIIQEILQDPTTYFTVLRIQNKFGVSNQTARNDLANLVENGVLEERRSGNKSQFLPFPGFIKKLTKGK
jgi:Fic family protein